MGNSRLRWRARHPCGDSPVKILPEMAGLVEFACRRDDRFCRLFGWTALMRRPGPNEITIGELIEAAQTGRFRVQSAVKERIAALSER